MGFFYILITTYILIYISFAELFKRISDQGYASNIRQINELMFFLKFSLSGQIKSKHKIEMALNKTRRNKKHGGKAEMKNRRNKTQGGKRKLSRGASDWHKSVMKVYKEMKAHDPSVKLGAAMKRAAELKRKGQL